MQTRFILAAALLLAAGAAGLAAWRMLGGNAALPTSAVIEAPDGHAYRYVAAPGISWDQARAI